MSKYPPDYFDGEPRPPLVVSENRVLHGTHQGSIYVQRGKTLRLEGTQQGSLTVESGGTAEIVGTQQGSLNVQPGAEARILGQLQGSLNNYGRTIVERGGTAAGSVLNEGEIVVRGRQGGASTGTGHIEFAEGSEIVRPVRRGGVDVYEWH